jgi:hypothetical protein
MLTARRWSEADPICLPDLKMGMVTLGVSAMRLETGNFTAQGIKGVTRAKHEFLNLWVRRYFHCCSSRSSRPNTLMERTGRRCDATNRGNGRRSDPHICLGGEGIHHREDGGVRSANIKYKLPGEQKFWVKARPIQDFVMVVPIEE